MAGGLGNQFFQYSAGKYVAKGDRIELVYDVYPVRKLDTVSEIFSQDLSANLVTTYYSKKSYFYKKVLNFALRRSAVVTKRGNDKKFLSIFISFLGLISFRIWERYFINNGLGWDKRIEDVKANCTLIGYFQSHEVGCAGKSSLKQMLSKIQVSNENIGEENWIMMHIRLTDYVGSNSLGHLDKNYYSIALSKFPKSIGYRVFTDGTIAELISKDFLIDSSKVVNTENLNSWQVLKLMSQGSGFIIANSSFSWWAAFLGVGNSKKVVAPKVWFRGTSPVDIHDPAWELI